LMCQLLELTADEIDSIEAAIQNAVSVESLPDAILDNGHTIRHKINAAVGHDLLGPTPPVLEQCPSVTIISKTSANPVMIGSGESSPISDNLLQQPSPATTTSQCMVDTPMSSIATPSTVASKQSSPHSQKTKHQPVNQTPRKRHSFNDCTRKDACRYHRNGAKNKTTATRK
jgi:hypothetical protein